MVQNVGVDASEEPRNKKIKIDNDKEKEDEPHTDCVPLHAFVVVLKSYHGWDCDSGPDSVTIKTRAYATMAEAEKARLQWMLENIVESLEIDHECPYVFNRSTDPFAKTVREKMYVFIDANRDKEHWKASDLHALLGVDADISSVHRLFYERDEYASTHEELFIQESK